MTRTLSFLPWTKVSTLAVVGITAAAAGLACSSSSAPPPANKSDASPEPEGAAPEQDSAAPEDAAAPPGTPCDAAIVLPADGGMGTACGQCLVAQCMSELATCQNEGCECVSNIECLAANSNSYNTCTDALSAIASGSPGLTALERCIVNSCMVCNPSD